MSYLDFRAIKARVSMLDVLDHFDLTSKLKRSGETLTGKCPIHKGDRGDSFRVSLDKNCYHCFSCRAHGNQLDLVVELEKCSLKDAARRFVEWFGLEDVPSPAKPTSAPAPAAETRKEVSVPVPSAAAKAATTPTASTANTVRSVPVGNKPLGFSLAERLDYHHPYLAERGLDEPTIREFGTGLCNAGTLIARIAIPLHNVKGELIGYVGRWPGDPPSETPKYRLPKGFKKSVELFSLHRAIAQPAEAPLVIVEGVFDAMHLWQHGARRVVALMGSSLSEAQEVLLREHARGSRMLLMLDEDEAGRSARDEIAVRLARFAYVRVHVFSETGTQPDRLTPAQIAEIAR